MTSYEKTVTETITLTDAFSTAWVVSKEYTETISLADVDSLNPGKLLSETITLTDGDVVKVPALILTESLATRDNIITPLVYQVASNGGYLTISIEQEILVNGLLNLINEMERQQCPMNQTTITATFDTNNDKYALLAIVRR